jgi:hypothetical protein
MQQRQLRLGDILDDYCPRERRVTNHAVVAMVGADVKQTRCTTCDSEHEYKHAKVPRQRRKADTPAVLYAQVAANGPKRVAHENAASNIPMHENEDLPAASIDAPALETPRSEDLISDNGDGPSHPETLEPERPDDAAAADAEPLERDAEEEGPVHRPLIRASLPRPEGQQPPARPIPEFTIRQPGGRPGRFRPRHPRGGQGPHFHGNRGNGNFGGGPPRGMRSGSARPQGSMPRMGRRHGGGGPGRKRSK